MGLASFNNKLVSLTDTAINQVCLTVSSSDVKTVQDVLPAPYFKTYGFLEVICYHKFQLAKSNGFYIMEEFGKDPMQTDYNPKVQFSTVAEARAAMSAGLFEAYCSPLSGKSESPQLYCNTSPY